MKNKKSFLTFGIIALVLFLGVGYAVVSSVYLNIGGTASVANADLKVEITNAVASTTVAEKTVDFNHTLSTDKLSSNFTLNGMELNETVSITYTVTNNETDVDAELALASGVDLTNSNADFFDVDYEITDSETDLENDDKTMEVVVNVSLIQTPVTDEEGTTTVGLKLAAIPKGGTENTGSSSTTTPLKFGEKYYAITSRSEGDIRDEEIWIKFYEDGRTESLDENGQSVIQDDELTYTSTNIITPNTPENVSFNISSDGTYLNVKIDSNTMAVYALESEYIRLSTIPLKFGQVYRCNIDNITGDSSFINSALILYPDGSVEMVQPDGQVDYAQEGYFSYSETEIRASDMPEDTKLVISSDGKTITQFSNDVLAIEYTLEEPFPLSWNTLDIKDTAKVLVEDETEFVLKITSDIIEPDKFYGTKITLNSSSENYTADYSNNTKMDEGIYTIEYINDNIRFIIIVCTESGLYYSTQLDPGIYLHSGGNVNSIQSVDCTIDYQ